MALLQMSVARKVAIGSVASTGFGVAVGYAMYQDRLAKNRACTAEAFNAAQDQERMREALAWVRKTAVDPSGAAAGLGLEMFRYTTCPYCGKLKAFLDYHRIPHETVEVEPMFKSQLVGGDYKKLPQLRFGGEGGVHFVDSDIVVDALAEQVGLASQVNDPNVQKWRSWARNSLVRHLTLNINESLVGAWQGYAYIDAFDTIPLLNKLFLKVVGAPVMYMVAQLKTRPALVEAGELGDGDDLRTVFHQQVERYVREVDLSDKKPFHGGSKPDLADLDVYGVLQSIRGHAIYEDLVQSTSIGSWVGRMDAVIGKAQAAF